MLFKSSLAANSKDLDGEWSGHFRRARYSAREYFISLSCSIQNIKSLRQILVILEQSNCLVAVRLDVPEARRLSFKPSLPDPDSSGHLFVGPIAARVVRLASICCTVWDLNVVTLWLSALILAVLDGSLLEHLLAALSNISLSSKCFLCFSNRSSFSRNLSCDLVLLDRI